MEYFRKKNQKKSQIKKYFPGDSGYFFKISFPDYLFVCISTEMLLIKPEVSNRSSGCTDTEKNYPLRRYFLQEDMKSATQRGGIGCPLKTWFISKQLKLELKLVLTLSERKRLLSVVSRNSETASFGVCLNQN